MPSSLKVRVGARDSKLSRVQVEEVLSELNTFHPEVTFDPLFIKSTGDLDKKTSLRTLGKSDFFTKELDQLLLEGKIQIAIHSAKDLPDPLPRGIIEVALTKGQDPSDSLVISQPLKKGALIATSSKEREERVKTMGEGLRFVDIRGTIEERLEKLNAKEIDGVVIAEAALIRLKLTHLKRIKVPGYGAPLQGKLSILARVGDLEMQKLFLCLGREGS